MSKGCMESSYVDYPIQLATFQIYTSNNTNFSVSIYQRFLFNIYMVINGVIH